MYATEVVAVVVVPLFCLMKNAGFACAIVATPTIAINAARITMNVFLITIFIFLIIKGFRPLCPSIQAPSQSCVEEKGEVEELLVGNDVGGCS